MIGILYTDKQQGYAARLSLKQRCHEHHCKAPARAVCARSKATEAGWRRSGQSGIVQTLAMPGLFLRLLVRVAGRVTFRSRQNVPQSASRDKCWCLLAQQADTPGFQQSKVSNNRVMPTIFVATQLCYELKLSIII